MKKLWFIQTYGLNTDIYHLNDFACMKVCIYLNNFKYIMIDKLMGR